MAEAMQEEEIVEDSLTADLAAAWDAYEEKEDEQAEPDLSPTPADSDSAPVEHREPTADAPADTRADTAVQEVSGDDKPPVGLSATAREVWKDAPKALKDEVIKRERDFAVGIQKYAENANRASQMDQALAPFQQYLAVTGEPPAKTIQGLLQTASILQMGSPVQRANTVASLIKQFGVDIRTLDDVLAGQQPREQPQRQIDPEIEELRAFANQVKQQQMWQAQQANQQVASEITQFAQDPKNEFYRDVAGDMADILDMAAKRNMNMSLHEAYTRACQLHPEVSKILTGRTATPTQKQRRAASSISGSPGGGGDDSLQSDSIRDAIERAWDMAGRT